VESRNLHLKIIFSITYTKASANLQARIYRRPTPATLWLIAIGAELLRRRLPPGRPLPMRILNNLLLPHGKCPRMNPTLVGR